MVKVSITLANSAQITVEAEETEVAHGVVGMVLREVPRDLMLSHIQPNGGQPPPASENGGNSVAPESHVPGASNQPSAIPTSPEWDEDLAAEEQKGDVSPGRDLTTGGLIADSSFAQFCRTANPMGDMRRVVVATEGARRFMGLADVDEETLGRLFDLAGWRRPPSFTQTLRNAGRSTYRWLERIPGRGGRYAVTEAGRTAALGE